MVAGNPAQLCTITRIKESASLKSQDGEALRCLSITHQYALSMAEVEAAEVIIYFKVTWSAF